jgi:hypothetical protein
MKTRLLTDARPAGRAETVAVEIALEERRDAVRLMNILIPFQSYVVQYDRDRWVVHARAPGSRGQSLDALLAAIDDWGARAGVTDFTCVVHDRTPASARAHPAPRAGGA